MFLLNVASVALYTLLQFNSRRNTLFAASKSTFQCFSFPYFLDGNDVDTVMAKHVDGKGEHFQYSKMSKLNKWPG